MHHVKTRNLPILSGAAKRIAAAINLAAASKPGKFYKYWIIDSVLIVKNSGLRGLLKKRGKKFVLFIIAYYTVRDSLVYLILPYFMAKGIF